jgi:8-amino-7-oxononanoate synthase
MPSLESQLRDALAAKEKAGLRRTLRAIPAGVLDLASNDYLGLARHPEVIEGAIAALREWGAGARASRLVSGNTPLHEQLESELAAWKGSEAALLFPSGYHANLSVISALARRGDLIFCDKRNHASLVDACRLASANGVLVRRYASLEQLHALAQKQAGPRCLVVSDTIFSMDGDRADIENLSRLADESGAVLILDDAHGTGVLENTELQPSTILIGTLSKALGAQGGFVCASQTVIDWLINAARPFIYTTGLSPANCGAALAALQIVQREPQRRARLRDVTEKLARGLQEIGFDARLQPSPIIPVMIGEAGRATALSEALLQHGVWCPAIRPPTVPKGQSRLRVSASAALSDEEIERALAAFRVVAF